MIQLLSVCNEPMAPIYVSERGIYAASTPNHLVTPKNSIRIAFATVKRHKCRAPAASQLNSSDNGSIAAPGTGALRITRIGDVLVCTFHL
jgi:hypothetical protein